MAERTTLDDIDRQILGLLKQDARRTVADISQQVALSQAPVKRRIDRMERAGIIAGYTTVLDYGKLGSSVQAFVEIRLHGDTPTDDVMAAFQAIPEIESTFTIAGDTDAMVTIRVDDVEHLSQIVNHLRRIGDVRGTRTLMVLDAWSRAR